LIDWSTAFAAYASLDERAEVEREAYLSAFTFGDEFRRHLDGTGTTKGYAGPCGSAWLWFDIDAGDDLHRAKEHAGRLAAFVAERYRLDDDDLLAFYSGAKGYHVGLPLSVCGSPGPSDMFHRVCRTLAERLAVLSGVTIDAGVYDAVRAFRAPNSRHPKTGLHKRRLAFDELLRLNLDAVLKLSATPAEFGIPAPPVAEAQAVDDWREATEHVERERAALAERRAVGASARLNRSTLAFLRNGAGRGDRHRLLFSAAANLAEFGCPSALAHELLTEAALDTGLPPSEVRRQIDCGLNHHTTKGDTP